MGALGVERTHSMGRRSTATTTRLTGRLLLAEMVLDVDLLPTVSLKYRIGRAVLETSSAMEAPKSAVAALRLGSHTLTFITDEQRTRVPLVPLYTEQAAAGMLGPRGMDLPALMLLAHSADTHELVTPAMQPRTPGAPQTPFGSPVTEVQRVRAVRVAVGLERMRNTVTADQLNQLLFLQSTMSDEINQLIAASARHAARRAPLWVADRYTEWLAMLNCVAECAPR
jgi:hypothetical protein